MKYTIYNDKLHVTIDSFGSELLSIKTNDGNEYMWQQDPKYWSSSAPVIFPFVARLYQKTYYIDGEKHMMDTHGFALSQEYDVNVLSNDEIVFSFKENEETLKQYPRKFIFSLKYKLVENKIFITYEIKNTDDKMMYFGIGAHPGFNVPLSKGYEFEDYYLEYETSDFEKVIFTPDCFVDKIEPYHLDKGILKLRHEVFDDDAIVLKGGHKVSLKSDKDTRSVIVEYPEMDYFSTWQRVKTDATFVCLEPWQSLPASKEHDTIFETKEDLVHLEPNKIYKNTYSIEIR